MPFRVSVNFTHGVARVTACFSLLLTDGVFLNPDRDEVRAPIPQKQEILVEPEPLFGGDLSRVLLIINT